MKKLIVLILLVACGVGLYFVLKGGGNGPKAVAGKYIEAVQRGDYKAALDLTALDEKTKEQYVALIKEKGGERKDSELIASYELGDESVDEEAGTASVVAHLTWDLLECPGDPLYPIIHIKEGDFEAAFTHVNGQSNDYYYSFVNGQHTTEGGTHQSAFREAYARVVKEFIKKDYSPEVIRQGLVCALCVRIQEPVFEAQTKTKLGSTHLEPNKVDGTNDSPLLKTYVLDILKRNLDNYLHMHAETADALLAKINANEKERKDIAGIKKVAREAGKKASLNNRKLRDCHVHYNTNHARRLESTIFITEGDSASGSITKSRDVDTQAVFSLRGKPKNTYSISKVDVYKNEELNLLHNALDIDDGIENLRYNNVVIATDADVDGMHIRLLLLTFFLRFYPELIQTGHVYILQTPLFRVRNKQKTTYCYTDDERIAAIHDTPKAEITRFKGLGEISPDEFKNFIGKDMRLDPVLLHKDFDTQGVLSFYMGENTLERREFIMSNLRIEDDESIVVA